MKLSIDSSPIRPAENIRWANVPSVDTHQISARWANVPSVDTRQNSAGWANVPSVDTHQVSSRWANVPSVDTHQQGDIEWQCGICREGVMISPLGAATSSSSSSRIVRETTEAALDDKGEAHEPERDESVEEVEEEPEQAVAPKVSKDPGLPTAQEREAHRATHLPYRAWCEECVMASKSNPGHKHTKYEPPEIPEVGVDYGFLREEGEDSSLTLMVVKDRESRVIFTHQVPTKGAGWQYSVDCLNNDITKLGHSKIVLMHDQEPALNDLCNAVAKMRESGVIQQSSPVRESQSNGRIEVAVRQSKNQVRVLKFALERRLGCKIPKDHPVMGFLIEHAGMLISKYLIGSDDGKTAFRRLLGKDCREEAIEFGESILYRAIEDKYAGLSRRWHIGTYLGRKWGTGECIVGTSEGILKCRAVQRRPADARWDKTAVEAIAGTPWCWEPKPGEDCRIFMPELLEGEAHAESEAKELQSRIPRRVNISVQDLRKYGFSEGCIRCRDLARGRRTTSSHNAQCRARIEGAMAANDVDKHRIDKASSRLDAYCSDQGHHGAESQRTQNEIATESSADADGDIDVDIDTNIAERLADDEPMEDIVGALIKYSSAIEAGDACQKCDKDLINSLMALNKTRKQAKAIVDEIYSVPRVTDMANSYRHLNIAGGTSYDLRTDEDTGGPWDFTVEAQRKKARHQIAAKKPNLLIGSPPCTDCSILNRSWNFRKMDPAEVRRRRLAASIHLSFCCQLYLDQLQGGRYFLHEHPKTADSWQHPAVVWIRGQPQVATIDSDMCQFGMCAKNQAGVMQLVLKPTKWMSNSRHILRRLVRSCPCRKGGDNAEIVPAGNLRAARHQLHRHTPLLSGRAAKAQEYPPDLCLEILRGLRNQIDEDSSITRVINSVGFEEEEDEYALQDQHIAARHGEYIDDVTGEVLNEDLVKAARAEEIKFLRDRSIYDKVPVAEAWHKTGRAPIDGRWVDHNKGTDTPPDVRCRCVAKDFNRGPKEGLFAAMPPLEAKRMLFSHVASNRKQGTEELEISFVDARKAYYNARPERPVYVNLPAEDSMSGMCARLNWCMYGTREAASRWAETFTKALVGLGFCKGKASPCIFFHPSRQLRLVVHGDDFTTTGTRKELDKFEKQLAACFEIKIRGRLGSRADCDKEVKILNRVVKWTHSGLTYEADPQHAQTLLKEFGLASSAGRVSPGSKIDDNQKEGKPLEGTEATKFRALAARANYLAQDRPDIGFAAKEVCRKMSAPLESDWSKLKRLVRYLRDFPTLVYRFAWQNVPSDSIVQLEACVDTDFAGCLTSRKSTSGGMIFLGDHLVRHWSSTQKTIALSSGEAELQGVVKGAAESLAIRSFGWDMGIAIQIVIHTDSSAAKGIVEREGIGRVRHLEVATLWVQERLKAKDFKLKKVSGIENPGDLLTKHLPAADILKHCSSASLFRHG